MNWKEFEINGLIWSPLMSLSQICWQEFRIKLMAFMLRLMVCPYYTKPIQRKRQRNLICGWLDQSVHASVDD